MADGTLKVGKIITSSGTGTVQIGQSGETIDIQGTFQNASFNTPAFEVYRSADQGITDAVTTLVEFDTKVLDTDNYYDNSTNYRYTPLVAGKYFFYTQLIMAVSSNNINDAQLYIRKNGDNYKFARFNPGSSDERELILGVSAIIDMNGTDNYVDVRGYINVSGGSPRFESGVKSCYFGGYRLGV